MAYSDVSLSDQPEVVQMGVDSDRGLKTPSPFRRIYSAVRHLPDRLLHRRRHLAVRERTSRMPLPRNILVVCYGNICRSPYLEAVLQRALPDVQISSAGFFGPGRPVPKFSLALAERRGLDLSAYRSRPITRKNIGEADLLLVMDAYQARRLESMFSVPASRIIVTGDLDPLPASTRAVEDPWQQPLEVFEASFDRLDRCARTLSAVLRRRT